MFIPSSYKNALTIIKNSPIINSTPLILNKRLSKKFNANIFFKREDLQEVRSFKIRGAYYKIMNSMPRYVATASAGNHAQGVAITCNELKIKHSVFVPDTTPKQKIDRIKHFGGKYLDLKIIGSNFDESLKKSKKFAEETNSLFVHPFDDKDIILGQSTIAQEIVSNINPDYICCAIGGGGLISGVGSYVKDSYLNTKIIGIEPENADSMNRSITNNKITTIQNLDVFVDGAAVKTIGKNNFTIGKNVIDELYVVSNNKLCNEIVEIYQNDGIIVEPAGALSVSCLDNIKSDIKGKNVVCIISGGNNDITRYGEMIEKSYRYNKLKHYFLLDFSQKPGELSYFISSILDNTIDITRFEYLKKTNKDKGSVLIGLELLYPEQIHDIIFKMKKKNYSYIKIEEDDRLFTYLI